MQAKNFILQFVVVSYLNSVVFVVTFTLLNHDSSWVPTTYVSSPFDRGCIIGQNISIASILVFYSLGIDGAV